VPGQRHAPVHPEPVAVCLDLQQMYPVADCCSILICLYLYRLLSGDQLIMLGHASVEVGMGRQLTPDTDMLRDRRRK